MCDKPPAWFRHQHQEPQSALIAVDILQAPLTLEQRLFTYKSTTSTPACRLGSSGPPKHQWFMSTRSAFQPQSTTRSPMPGVGTVGTQADASQHSSSSAVVPGAQAASHATWPACIMPVSNVMSHDTTPGLALRPCSPWRRTPSQTDLLPAATAPHSLESVVIARDTTQPTLAQALGFAEQSHLDQAQSAVKAHHSKTSALKHRRYCIFDPLKMHDLNDIACHSLFLAHACQY